MSEPRTVGACPPWRVSAAVTAGLSVDALVRLVVVLVPVCGVHMDVGTSTRAGSCADSGFLRVDFWRIGSQSSSSLSLAASMPGCLVVLAAMAVAVPVLMVTGAFLLMASVV